MSNNDFTYGLATGIAICAGLFSLGAAFVYINNQRAKNAKAAAHASQPLALSSIAVSDDRASTSSFVPNETHKISPDEPNPATLVRLQHLFEVNGDKLSQIAKHMVAEMKKGLATDDSTLKMIPTHVVRRPKGDETGSYLALDLGGTNFRVCEVTLDGRGGTRVRQSKHTVTDDLKNGTGAALFDFFAECVKQFLLSDDQKEVTDKDLHTNEFKLGFTFSFAVNQVSINSGFLMGWNKGFSASDCVGKDAVVLLQDAFKRKRMNVSVTALVNDTTGTLVSHAYSAPDTYVGVILGTGTNAAYVEKIENITKYKKDPAGAKDMIINTEWGAFDDEMVVIPRTKYDHKVDRGTANAKSWTFEKLISGMYLGEICRYVLVDLVKTGEIYIAGGSKSKTLSVPHAFETAFMSRIERDHSLDLSDVRTVLEDLMHIPGTTLADRRLTKAICEMIGKRAARLSAAGIAAIVTKMNKLDGCTVGIDGSLFELYPHFSNRMRDAMHEILGFSAENIVLEQARDGSGQGAALIAALAGKLTA
ncbi:hexokinase [Chytriomyces confervae]|uniref:Phosphotransferase n=1 Tax=Chytriomyces confervae TaxID=246404 RepID=A0A507F7P6_9FUNG|nr:hexokinase [Chytriomyces confervae]